MGSIQDERGFNQGFKLIGSTSFRARRRGDWFIAEAKRVRARRILELGCGTGETASHVSAGTDADVLAVDISNAFISQARATYTAPNLHFRKLDLLNDEPLLLGDFDLVMGNGILHHLGAHLVAVLRRLHEITNPGGRLAFIEPNILNPYCAFIFGTNIGRRWAKLEPGEMAFKPGALRDALPASGWRDVRVCTRDFLVPGVPKMLVSPILAIEPALEATSATRWLAQSHFVTAEQ